MNILTSWPSCLKNSRNAMTLTVEALTARVVKCEVARGAIPEAMTALKMCQCGILGAVIPNPPTVTQTAH